MSTPQHYPIEPGILYGGEYPGHPTSPDLGRARVAALVDAGIRTFVDLTTPQDKLQPYEHFLTEIADASGLTLQRISHPIPDMGIPDVDTMRAIIQTIREATASHPAVYIHCWGGIGRTGTVVGCWFRECGQDAASALALVQHRYSSHMEKAKNDLYPHSPQAPAQFDFVKRWSPS